MTNWEIKSEVDAHNWRILGPELLAALRTVQTWAASEYATYYWEDEVNTAIRKCEALNV